MSDLSDPPLTLIPATADEFVWPTPALASYPAASASPAALACQVEGVNGRIINGRLLSLDPVRGLVLVRVGGVRTPMPLRFEQFRRLRLLEPLLPLPVTGHPDHPAPADAVADVHAARRFSIQMSEGGDWSGHTVGHCEEPWGLFVFEPVDATGTLRRTFVPRHAYRSAEIGPRLGEVLVEHHAASPEQVEQALDEQRMLRERKLGDLLLVRQIVTQEELIAAIEQQAKMPMVRIGEALTTLGYITEAQLEDALAQQREDRSVPLGELLVRRGDITRAELQTALARKMGYPLVDVVQFPTATDAVTRLPYATASRLLALPLIVRGGRLVVAVEDPTSRSTNDEIEFAAQIKVVPVLARAGVLGEAIDRAYEKIGAATGSVRFDDEGGAIDFGPGDASKLAASLEQQGPAAGEEDEGPAIEQSDNSLVRLINSMIMEAHSQGVSDIHVECPAGREKVRIRFRKDGLLRNYLDLPPSYRSALVARLKIMCDLDISERRKPQDGKINFSKFVQGVRLELRVATIPTHAGHEDAVLRLLASHRPLPIDKIGLAPRNLERLKQAVARPYGMILCVGPTGSGKTTTLHSALSHVNTAERKIWTAEDPVEITQAGLRQVQVNPRIDWTFAKALRAFLRADPDVIMVGEIRDQETAQVAVEASLTGHLLLSTLHTNSAAETVTRLLDMGMDPFNFADALVAVLAQRLVRRLCTHCRSVAPATDEEKQELLHDYLAHCAGIEPVPSEDDLLAAWRRDHGSDGRIARYRSAGCEHCGGTGYRGRVALHELLVVSRPLRALIQNGSRSEEILRQALKEGMTTLRQDGIEKVLAGLTSIEEVRANS